MAILTETPINKLLIAGILPGIVLAVITVVIIFVWVRINPSIAPGRYHSTWADRRRSLADTWPSAILIVLILGMLYTGVVTPTEVAGIGAFGALLLALALRKLKWNAGLSALRATACTTAMIFAILIGRDDLRLLHNSHEGAPDDRRLRCRPEPQSPRRRHSHHPRLLLREHVHG